MSWFDSSGLAGFAKTALTNAQKKIDKVLDIEENDAPVTSSASSPSSTASTASPARPSRVVTGGGAFGGAYGAYVPPVAPKAPPTIRRDAEPETGDESSITTVEEKESEDSNDWASQSSLWSSWFDFSAKDGANGEGEKSGAVDKTKVERDVVEIVSAKKGAVVAAQPPSRVAKEPNFPETASPADVKSETKAPAALTLETESSKPSDQRKSRRSKESIEARKAAKPAPPKKLGQRLSSEGKSNESVDAGAIIRTEIIEIATDQGEGNDDEGTSLTTARLPVAEIDVLASSVNTPLDASESTLPVTSESSSSLATHASSHESIQTVNESKPDRATPPSSTSLMTTSSSASFEGGDSLSASACWEVKEGDAEVDAILKMHEYIEPRAAIATSLKDDDIVDDGESALITTPAKNTDIIALSSDDHLSHASDTPATFSASILTTQPASRQNPVSSLPPLEPSSQPSFTSLPTSSTPLDDTLTTAPFIENHDVVSSLDASIPSSLSTTTISDPTVIHAAYSDQDLTSFSLSQSSLSATKLTDSSTTEGTLGPDEEEEGEENLGEDEDESSMADIGNIVAQTSDLDSTPSPEATRSVDVVSTTTTTKAAVATTSSSEANILIDPLMSSSISSISSNVVKDLLGDAMTESLNSMLPPATPPLSISDSSDSRKSSANEAPTSTDGANEKNNDAVASATENDSYDDDEDPGGSVSDNGKGGYNSSDEVNTACTTSDEREETATSSDIEIISNPSILDGDANDRRFEVTSPLRAFGPLPLSTMESSQDVIFHHQSLLQGFHQRTPSQSSSCSSSTNVDKKKNFHDWNELKIDTQERRAGESDSPFESPNFDDSENEDADATTKKSKAGRELLNSAFKPVIDANSAQTEMAEKSAGSVRQRLKEETEGGEAEEGNAAAGVGRRTPRMSRSRKSSERHLSTATLTASSEDKDDEEDNAAEGIEVAASLQSGNDDVVNELVKKMKAMAEVIQAREANAFDLSKMNAELTETVNTLRQQVANANAARDNTSSEMDRMTEEFARRLGESENKLRTTAQDRDAIKRELNQALKDIQSKAALDAIVKEKEDLVQELMEEGRKLSLQLGNANTALRKLRAKEKENEGVSQRRKEKAETAEKRVEELEAAMEEAAKREKTKTSRMEQLEEKVKILESIKFESESQMEDDKAKMESLKVSLEAANQEISSLKSRVIEADSLVAEAQGKAERNATKAIEKEFERAQETLIGEREALAAALEDLRVHVARQERDMSRREDVLKQELSALQSRLQEADARNEQLVESMGGATLPLLRQIESLKLTMSTQASSWEAVEANLNDRLLESQEQLIAVEEKERVVSEELFDVRGRLTAETSKAASLSTEKTLLKTELETLKMKLTAAEEAKSAQALQTSSVKTALSQEINELKIVKLDLENQVQTLSGKVVELERRHRSVSPPPSPRRSSTPRPFSPPPPLLSHPSTSSIGATYPAPFGVANSAPSLYNVVRESGGSFQIEEMQSQLKQKDGEICQLQTDIMNLELTRESMASELVELANKNTALEESTKHYPVLKKEHADMEVQYNALLQMFGEKVEEYDELRMDLEHVKSMYKQQIDELMQKESFRR